MSDILLTFATQLAADRKSIRTIKTYGAIMASFFAFFEKQATNSPCPSRSDVEAFLSRPRRNGLLRSTETRNLELSALRAFASLSKRSHSALTWKSDPTDGIAFLKVAFKDPPVLSASELRHLFMLVAERSEPLRSRDLALLAVLSQLGLRVHEVVRLDVAQVDLPSATLVSIKGKGGTVHDLPLNVPAISLLTSWLKQRQSVSVVGEPALFVNRFGTRLSTRSVERLLVDLRLKLGTPKKITPHTLRHSAATLALTMGVDLATVGELLRHTSLNTTRRYLHLVDERRREAVRRLGATVPAELLDGVATSTVAAVGAEPGSNTRVLSSLESEKEKTGVVDDCYLGDVDEAA